MSFVGMHLAIGLRDGMYFFAYHDVLTCGLGPELGLRRAKKLVRATLS